MGQKHQHENSHTSDHPYVPQPVIQPVPVVVQTPTSPAPVSNNTPSNPSIPPAQPMGGNGMIYCSGPQAPGYNVSTHKCDYNPVHAITPTTTQTAKPQFIRLDQLPYTGDNPGDVALSAAFYLFVILAGCLAIYRLLQAKGWL